MKLYFKQERIDQNANEYSFVVEVYSDPNFYECVGCFYFSPLPKQTVNKCVSNIVKHLTPKDASDKFVEYQFIEGSLGYIGNVLIDNLVGLNQPIPENMLLRQHSLSKIM